MSATDTSLGGLSIRTGSGAAVIGSARAALALDTCMQRVTGKVGRPPSA